MTDGQTEAIRTNAEEQELIRREGDNDSDFRELADEVLGTLTTRAFHNFPDDPKQQWKLSGIASGAKVKSASDVINTEIAIKYFIIEQVRLNGDTPGEFKDALRTVVIDDNDNAVQFVSEGMAKEVMRIVQFFGKGPYEPPLKAMLRQIDVGNNRRTYRLEPVE